MAKSTVLFRQCIIPRQSRSVSTTSPHRTSTSPQRRSVAAPSPATSLKPFNEIPGPLALPMLRHSAHVLPRIGNFHHTVGLGLLEVLQSRYGDLVRLAKASRTRPVLYIFHPELMREVYESCSTEPPQWARSPLQSHRTSTGCPFHGDETKAIWASIGALLEDPTLLKNLEKSFNDIAVDATRRFGELRKAENALNEELETEVYRWALETLGMAALGTRLGCLAGAAHVPTSENRNPEKTSMDDEIPDLCSLSKRCPSGLTPAEALVRCTREISDAGYLVRSENTLKTESKTFNNALKALDKHYSLTEHFVQQAMSELNSTNPKPEQVLLNKLAPLKQRILPLVADVLLAGVNPLAQSALAMLYHLSLNPARQQRAHDEICWSAASHEAGAGVQELPYLAACAREALRLHPATGGVVRRSTEAISVGGYEVPAGVDIVLAHGVTSKSENQWGRAKAFIPERWCSEGWEPLRASRAHPLASLPFGTRCPASGFAGHVLASLATRVLERYRLEWHGPAANMVTTGVNKVQAPYYFVLQDAH